MRKLLCLLIIGGLTMGFISSSYGKIVETLRSKVSAFSTVTKPEAVYSKLPKRTLSVELRDEQELGTLSAKYESGRAGAGTVSRGKDDPGGVSYGLYQLSTKTGTCARFIRYLKNQAWSYLYEGLFEHKCGTKEFSAAWRRQSKAMKTFGLVQHEFIKNTHYSPVRSWATKCGLIDHPVVNQVLWSMSVQHKKAKEIVTAACKGAREFRKEQPLAVINSLYQAREAYVKRLRSLSPSMKKSLLRRYKNERSDALEMLE